MAKAARVGCAEQPDACIVDQLQKVFAVKGKQRRVHHFKNARQQSRGFERAHPLLLQQVGKCVDLSGQFAKCIAIARPSCAKRIVAFAQ